MKFVGTLICVKFLKHLYKIDVLSYKQVSFTHYFELQDQAMNCAQMKREACNPDQSLIS